MYVSGSLVAEQKDEEVRSPQRKKKKKDKRKDKKDKKKKAEAESILCPGRFGRQEEGISARFACRQSCNTSTKIIGYT